MKIVLITSESKETKEQRDETIILEEVERIPYMGELSTFTQWYARKKSQSFPGYFLCTKTAFSRAKCPK